MDTPVKSNGENKEFDEKHSDSNQAELASIEEPTVLYDDHDV
jgi:hypothetical protein